MDEQTNQQVVLENLSKVLVWAKDAVVLPRPNPKAMASWLVRYGIAVGAGVIYAWEINPITYVGANIYDLPVNTQLPIVLGLAQILTDVQSHPYSVRKVIEIINELGISNQLMCSTQVVYLNYSDVMATALQMLNITC